MSGRSTSELGGNWSSESQIWLVNPNDIHVGCLNWFTVKHLCSIWSFCTQNSLNILLRSVGLLGPCCKVTTAVACACVKTYQAMHCLKDACKWRTKVSKQDPTWPSRRSLNTARCKDLSHGGGIARCANTGAECCSDPVGLPATWWIAVTSESSLSLEKILALKEDMANSPAGYFQPWKHELFGMNGHVFFDLLLKLGGISCSFPKHDLWRDQSSFRLQLLLTWDVWWKVQISAKIHTESVQKSIKNPYKIHSKYVIVKHPRNKKKQSFVVCFVVWWNWPQVDPDTVPTHLLPIRPPQRPPVPEARSLRAKIWVPRSLWLLMNDYWLCSHAVSYIYIRIYDIW